MNIPNLPSALAGTWRTWLAAFAFALAAAPALAGIPPLEGVVNLNAATAEQLELLPGVGESRARAIIALRKERGSFKSVDELKDVKGIGDALIAELKPYVRLSGKTTAKAAEQR